MKDGQKRGLKGADLKAFVVNQMTDVIQGQVACGILVSAHSYSKEPNAVLSKDLQQKLDAIGDGYKRATNATMHVNSGYRTPAGQAAAMYDKFQAGASGKDYENQDALREIKHKYDQAMKDGEKRGLKGADLRTFVVSQMTDVIQGQVDDGMLISKHLTGDAADVRTNNLTQQQKNALEQAAKQAGGKTHPEGKPEHLHVEFPPQRVANK
jgi:hypothetical protein